MSDIVAVRAEVEWIHRRTWSDGRVEDTAPRAEHPKRHFCLAGLSEAMSRRTDPGVTVVHLMRRVGETEWRPEV